MLSQLPLELVDAIADWSPPRSVRSLSLVSTALYAALFPRLHRAITFCASNEWALNILDVSLFLKDCPDCRAEEILHGTRELTVKAPIHIARFHRCVYNSNFIPPAMSAGGFTLGSPHEPTAHRGFLESLSSQIHQVIIRLEPGILNSFQWHTGTCVPTDILDAQGYFVRQQKQIRRLPLITNGTCPHTGQQLEGLSDLAAVTELEWEGIQHPPEVRALRDCLQRSYRHLEVLAIGLLSEGNSQGGCDFFDLLDLSPASFHDGCPQRRAHPGFQLNERWVDWTLES